MTKQLNEGFKRSVYWNSYETKLAKVIEQGKTFTNYLMALKALKSFQGIKRLFVLAYFVAVPLNNNPADDTAGIKSNKYFLPRGKITTY